MGLSAGAGHSTSERASLYTRQKHTALKIDSSFKNYFDPVSHQVNGRKMRINSSVWLLIVVSFIVVLESVSSFPAKDAEESIDTTNRPLTAVRKHSKSVGHINKKKKQHAKNGEQHRHHHSSRGLKQVDYDYAAMAETATTAVPAQRKKIKDDRSPWSPKRRNKKSSNRKNNKNNKKNNNKRQAVRTTRRAGTFNDQVESDDAGQNQLLGLGVFGDMRKFFDELRSNLDVDTVAAEAEAALAERGLAVPKQQDNPSQIAGLEDYEDLPNYQALRTTTGLDASVTSPVQQQRRYSRLRGFVAMGGPGSPSESSRHHRNHPYDPALLWTGLGRRR